MPPSVAAVPAMTAALPRSPLTGSRLLELLNAGGGPETPIAAPFAWAAAAASRRELAGAAAIGGLPGDKVIAQLTLILTSALTYDANPQMITGLANDTEFTSWIAGIVASEVQEIISTYVTSSNVALTDAQIVGNAVATFAQQVLNDGDVSDYLANRFNELSDVSLLEIAYYAAENNPGEMLDAFGKEHFAKTIRHILEQSVTATALAEAINVLTGVSAGVVPTDPQNSLAQSIGQLIAPAVAGYLGSTPLAGAAGFAVGSVVQYLLTADPTVASVVSAGLGSVASTALSTFMGQPDIPDTVKEAVKTFAEAFIDANANANAAQVALQAALQYLTTQQPFINAVPAVVTNTFDAFETDLLQNIQVEQNLDDAFANLISDLASNPSVAGNAVAQLVFTALGSNPLAAVGGTAAGIAIQTLLGDSSAVNLLAQTVGTSVPDFLTDTTVLNAVDAAIAAFGTAISGGSSLADATQAALAALQADAGFTSAAASVVANLVSSLLITSGQPSALVNGLGQAVGQGLSSALVLDASTAGGLIEQWVNGQIGGRTGAVVGYAAGVAVENLLANSPATGALAQAIGSLAPGLLGDPTVSNALANAAGQIASAVAGGMPFTDAVQTALTALQSNTAVTDAATLVISARANELLGDAAFSGTLGSAASTLVSNLFADEALRSLVGDELAQVVSDGLGIGFVGDAVGRAAGGAVTALLDDPFVRDALGAAVGALVTTFLNQPDIGTTLTLAVEQFAGQVLAGTPADAALTTVLQGLQSTPEVQAALDGSVGAVVSSLQTDFLGSQAVQRAVGSAVDSGMIRLLSAPEVRTLIGDQATQIVLSDLGAQGAAAFGKATSDLLARGSVIRGLSELFGYGVTDFLGQTGVDVALGGALQQVVDDVAAGIDPSVALQTALESLIAVKPQLGVAIDNAITRSGTVLLGNPAVQGALGSTVEYLINAFTADPALRAALKNQLGPTWGSGVTQLLDDPNLRDDLAAALGGSVGSLLNQPGVITQLTTVGQQVADSVLDGATWGDALLAALASVRGNAIVQTGVNAIIPGTIASLLARPDIRVSVGGAAVTVVNSLLGEYGIDPGSLGPALNYLVKNATAKALAAPTVTALLGDAAARYIDGESTDDVVTFILQGITRSPELRGVLGTAVGETIGDAVASLSGNGSFGTLVGLVAGGIVTTALEVAAQYTLLSTNGVGPIYGDATVPSAGTSTYLYVMSLSA